jgi:NAD(P) transhydrogenase subunit beta
LLEQPLLVLVGALVGVSGAMLSAVMCKAMNRSFLSVIAGGFGAQTSAAGQGAAATQGTVALAGTADAAYLLQQAEHVVIVPGYGMAVAQAQHAVKALYAGLTAQGVAVHFAIHPVAGRMPGHMNVLLAEADIPYDAVWELEEAAPRMAETDAVLVLGANDVVNPAAETDRTSPIFGMPVLPVWQAKQVYVVKRSHKPGYAGIDNPLFSMPNCALVLGDAKAVVEALVAGVKDHT